MLETELEGTVHPNAGLPQDGPVIIRGGHRLAEQPPKEQDLGRAVSNVDERLSSPNISFAPRLVFPAWGTFPPLFLIRGPHAPRRLTYSNRRSLTDLSIVCEACSRRGAYAVERLINEHGDKKLTHLLPTLASCPKSRSTSIYDGCTVVYEGLTFTRSLGLAGGSAGLRLSLRGVELGQIYRRRISSSSSTRSAVKRAFAAN
jgi:hypothetical protein